MVQVAITSKSSRVIRWWLSRLLKPFGAKWSRERKPKWLSGLNVIYHLVTLMLEKKQELRYQECNSHWFCIASPYSQVHWNVDMEEDNERLNGTQNYSENDKIPCKYIHIPVFVPVFFGRGNSPPQPKKTYNPPNGCQIVRNFIHRLAFKTPINT